MYTPRLKYPVRGEYAVNKMEVEPMAQQGHYKVKLKQRVWLNKSFGANQLASELLRLL